MLVVHPASLCDVCLDPYIISSEPANSPHAIACGHIFCLACLRNLSPSACPLCRKAFQPDRVKKLHVAGPPELDGAAEESIEEEATQLLQRVVLVSGEEDAPDIEIIEIVTQVEEWLTNNSEEENSYQPLRAALAALQRFKALQERNEREYTEFRRVRRELKAYRRNAHQDSKTARAIEESLQGRITEIESKHAMEVSQEEQGFARLTQVFQLSRLHAEIDSLRGDTQPSYRNTPNPLPPPPEPLPLDRFPAFARPGGTADTSDLPTAVPYPPPPPRVQPATTITTNGYPSVTSYSGATHAQYIAPVQVAQPLAVPRARHADVPRGDERSRRPSTQEVNGINHPEQERRPHAEFSRAGGSEARYAGTDARLKASNGPLLAPRAVPAASPAPSWAYHPLVEERRSDDEREAREVHRRGRMNGSTNGVVIGGFDADPRPSMDTRLLSAEAYVQGYGSGLDSGFQIASEPASFPPSSYGNDRSDRVHGFPVQESPDQPIGGLGLMGVPQPTSSGTVSTPDEDATPVNRPRGLSRRNTTQAVDMDRSARRFGDQPPFDVPQNGGRRRVPVRTMDRVHGVRRTVTESALLFGEDDSARRHRTASGVAVPLAGENESPRSETTWGTVQTLSRDSFSGGSMSSLAMLVGLHNGGGVRGQGSVGGESYIGREGLGDIDTGEEGEDGEMETPIVTGSLPGSESDVSSLGLIREDEGDYTGSRNRHVVDNSTSHARSTSYSERTPHALEARYTRRSEGTNGQRRHASQSSIAEVLQADSRRVDNGTDITSTNALSLHFDASFPTHDLSGPEIFAPTPIVGGPNVIHLWAGRA